MKYLLTLILTALTIQSFGQTTTIQVDPSKLTPDQRRVYDEMVATSTDNSSYAEIGKAFGEAFKACWTTVSDDAVAFANSDAGKLTMIILAWKLIGKEGADLLHDMFQVVIGFIILMLGIYFTWKSYRNKCMKNPILVSQTKLGWITIKNEYNGVTDGGDDEFAFTHGAFFIALIVICCFIMFA